jgi:L-lactate dehydrogenase complex protein LldE
LKVSLFITCLVDQLFPKVGHSTVEVLRRVGCEVIFDERQTCCGQPAFNTGYRKEASGFAKRFIEIFEENDCEAIVCPSGSCTAMVRHFHELFNERNWTERAKTIAAKTYELTEFLVDILKVQDVDSTYRAAVSWHDACHGLRELGVRQQPRLLLKNVKGLKLIEVENADVCCGFGGTFSIKYPEISAGMVDNKIGKIEASNVRVVTSGDSSCLMQIGGRLSRLGSNIGVVHIAEILASQAE